MVLERTDPADDFWSMRDTAGSSATWVFSGVDGLERLSGPATFSAPDPHRFRARLTRVQVDHIALEGFAATAHRSIRGLEQIAAHPTPLLTFLFLRTGQLHVDLPDASFDLAAGEFFILDSRRPVTITTDGEIRVLTSMVGLDHVPAHLLDRGTTIPTPLQRTPLVDSFVAFQATILASSMAGRTAHGDELIRAIAELHAAVLAEAQKLVGEPTGPAALRHRMEEYIDAHLAEPDLRPDSIATAVGISLRHAHNVFNDGDRTISRYIRDRRVDAVAFTLRTSTDRAPLADLATRHGFVSADAMTRAFTERYGSSPSGYRARAHRAD